MEKQQYSCAKCSPVLRAGEQTQLGTGELRTTGSGLTRFLNIQNQKYATVACTQCGYTDLYRLDGSGVGNKSRPSYAGSVFDFFTN